MVNVTALVQKVVAESAVSEGLCTLFVQHTSASLVIQENTDPAVRADLQEWMGELASPARDWRHDDEGPDDMPAHARAAITHTSEVIPISAGRLALGTWQAVYLWEHRVHATCRNLLVHIQGR